MALSVSKTLSLFFFAFVFTLSILCLFTEAYNGGFTVDLIHRDSPNSPFYNSSETPSQRLTKSLHRSFHRANRFNPTSSSSYSTSAAESEIIGDGGEYLMKFGIGTPPVEVLAVADTGSDLIWTQCEPCDQCFKQSNPIFDPTSSETYKKISCSSKQCQSYNDISCSEDGITCEYSVSYGDGSSSTGNLAVETITLGSTRDGSPAAFNSSIIGCGHNNDLTHSGNTSGIVGLGGGGLSLVSQIGSGKFSYCLLPLSDSESNSSTSKLKFGENAVVSGGGTVSTPLVSGGGGGDTFYYLKLDAISVGDERLDFGGSSSGGEGNIIIDSGTTLTLVPQEFYSSLESAVSSKINAEKTDDPSGTLSLCYKAEADFTAPDITVHFTNNADVKLSSLNTFVRVSEDINCLTFAPSDQGISIFGNLAQMNFLVGYDTDKHTVSFKPTDCSKS